MAKIGIDIKGGALIKDDIVVGIDLGTTNSLVARVEKGGHAVAIGGKNAIVPSVIHLDIHGNAIVGNAAKMALLSNPESTIFSVKRLLGRSYEDIAAHAEYFTYRIIDEKNDQLVRIEANGKYYTPIELSGLILAELKRKAEDALGRPVKKAVITVPAYFNDNQRQATRDAGKLAGLEVLRIVNEPTAASLAYGFGLDQSLSKTILVYDLGGGTFDVSILKIESGVFEVLSTSGDTYLGGDDIDRKISMHWLSSLGLTASQLSKSEMGELRLTAEAAKIKVSSGKRYNGHWYYKQEEHALELTENDLNSICQSLLEKTLVCVKNALKDADLGTEKIDEVVLVGGSTRLPQVTEALKKIFAHSQINNSLNPDEVVALGAAIEADVLMGNRNDVLLLDVTPLSLGIETAGGLMDVVIPRNNKIPCSVGREYTTSVDGQVNMKIAVFQGERELVAENRKLAEFELKGIPAMPAGFPKVEISFLLDADGILRVKAVETRSGVRQEIAIKPQYGLDDSMVETMLEESLKNAQQDMQIRLHVEAKTEAAQLIYTAERFLQKNADMLTKDELLETKKRIADLVCLKDTAERDAILAGIDQLNDYTRPFAERLMDMAVSKALKGTTID